MGSSTTIPEVHIRRETLTRSWSWIGGAVLTALAVVLYATVLKELASDWWNDPSSSHGILIPPLVLYLAWVRRKRTLDLPAEPNRVGLAATGLACALFLLGKLSAEFFISRLSFVLLLAGLAWTFWGRARLRTLVFPLLLLATMIPLPLIVYNALAVKLQLFASQVSSNLAQALGVTVFAEGNVIHLAGTT
ncbi:MAG: exosortase, partial [Acidobacteria bacterium]|nr:exosortase [Acidobacteriota bacterium]